MFREGGENNDPRPKSKGRLRIPNDPEHPVSFDSKLEERAWREWALPAAEFGRARYQSVTFRMAGGSYTPDFDISRVNGERWFVEVKPNNLWNTHASGRSSKRNIKQACAEYADYGRWFLLYPDSTTGAWTLEELTPKKEPS